MYPAQWLGLTETKIIAEGAAVPTRAAFLFGMR